MFYYSFINTKTNKVDDYFAFNFESKEAALEHASRQLFFNDDISIKPEISEIEKFDVILVELSHQLPHNNIEFMFVLPSRTDAMLAQTAGVPPVGRWLPKVVEIISDHMDGDFRHIDVYFDDDADSFGVTVAKVNEKTGFVNWCCPEYKNHPQVFEHISNL